MTIEEFDAELAGAVADFKGAIKTATAVFEAKMDEMKGKSEGLPPRLVAAIVSQHMKVLDQL